MLNGIFEKFVCMWREWIGVACAWTSDCVEEAEEPDSAFKMVFSKMGSALFRTGPARETPPPPPETDPAMGTAMLKTYSEFDNVPGARVYGVLVGKWSWVGAGGSGQVFRVTGAGGESRIVKLLAWPSDETQAAGGGGGACAPEECGPDRGAVCGAAPGRVLGWRGGH